MPNVAILGRFAASFDEAIRRNLTISCEIVVSDEAGIIPRLADIEMLVTMELSGRNGARLSAPQARAGARRGSRPDRPLGDPRRSMACQCPRTRERAFDMKICAVRRNARRSAEAGLSFLGGPDRIDEIIGRSDYVLISMPATPDTVGLMNRRRLGLMKPTAFLINVARAEIVDEDALYRALAGRSIAGAALDVWYRYPREPGPASPAARPFGDLPNRLMTPHVSGWTDGMLDARAKLIAENIRRVARREIPLNLVAS